MLTVVPPLGSLWVEVECKAENQEGEAIGRTRGHAHFLPTSVEASSPTTATTPGTTITFSCAALRSFPAPRLIWRAELEGERVVVLEEEGEANTEPEEDGTVSSYSSLKVAGEEQKQEI